MLDQKTMAARYILARKAFCDNAAAAGWKVESIKHPLKGPLGIPIYMDVAFTGNSDADELVMMSSGTHGVEGYLGSMIQSRLLAEGMPTSGCHAVMIHGVNPYGFAWHRRVNENNVDLNRNFIDFTAPLPVNESYDALYDLLNPLIWSEGGADRLATTLADMTEELGLLHVFRAVSGGQYAHPDGMQYGGHEPTWSRLQLTDVWNKVMEGKHRAIQIDLHSGLGERGQGVLMTFGEDRQARIVRARDMWGEILVSPPAGGPNVLTTGVLGPHLENLFPDAEVLAVVLEFGTVPPDVVGRAMVADNWLHHYGDIDAEQGQKIKQDALDAFYIGDPQFLDIVYERARDVVLAAFTSR